MLRGRHGEVAAVVLVAAAMVGLVARSFGNRRSQALLGAPARGRLQRLQSLAYSTYKPEANPLADFDKGFVARPYGASAKPEKNPLRGFNGYGFSTVSHAQGVSPYPATKAADTHNVYDDMPEGKYPFDERKNGLKEKMHTWQHWDWRKAPPAAIGEVNVWSNTGQVGSDTSDDSGSDPVWQLGDPLSFKWKHWKKKGLAENAPTKAIGEVNVWDSPHIYYPSWKSTPKSVVDDPNDSKDGTEQNVLMNYQFPNY